MRIPGGSVEDLLDVAESDGHAYTRLVEGVVVDLLPNVQQGRLYRYDLDSGNIANLGLSCCTPTIVTSASYADDLLAETVAHVDGADDDMHIERIGAAGRNHEVHARADRRRADPSAGRRTQPGRVTVATVVGVVDQPGMWLEWCDLATGADDRFEVGQVIPPGRMHLDFDGRYALASGMLRLPAVIVDTHTKRTAAVDPNTPNIAALHIARRSRDHPESWMIVNLHRHPRRAVSAVQSALLERPIE